MRMKLSFLGMKYVLLTTITTHFTFPLDNFINSEIIAVLLETETTYWFIKWIRSLPVSLMSTTPAVSCR